MTGCLCSTTLASSFGTANLATLTSFSTGITAFAMPLAHTLPGIVALAGVWGFFSGSVFSLAPATVGLVAKFPGEMGTRLGIFYAAASVPALFGKWSKGQ